MLNFEFSILNVHRSTPSIACDAIQNSKFKIQNFHLVSKQ